MTAEKIQTIKQYQSDYFIKYGERLIVDFGDMQGIKHFRLINTSKEYDEEEATAALSRICFEHKTSPEKVRSLKRIYKSQSLKEYNVINDYARWVKNRNFSYSRACKLINRNRTTLNHYLKDIGA